jgi:type I restriction enzyme S subunit
MGEAAIIPEDTQVCMGQRMMLLRPFHDLLSKDFLLLALREPLFQSRMVESAVGMTVKHLRVEWH